MSDPTAPKCPMPNCPGTFARKWQHYHQCDTCGIFTSRMARGLEWVHIKIDRARKLARANAPTKAEIAEAKRKASRQMVLEIPQMPVEGWSANEWFPGCVAETGQIEMEGLE